MGDFYQVVELAGVFYIEYQSEKTGWNTIAVQLTNNQSLETKAFFKKQADEKRAFLKGMIAAAKSDQSYNTVITNIVQYIQTYPQPTKGNK